MNEFQTENKEFIKDKTNEKLNQPTNG